MPPSIRPETQQDTPAIREVNLAAFQPRRDEANLVELLRERGKAKISLVAETEGQVVGHILFSPVTVAQAPSSLVALGLAPLAVLPDYQGWGIGSALSRAGLEACRQAGCDLVVVLGDPRYYSRFGFQPAKPFGLDNEYQADHEFEVLALRAEILKSVSGLVRYAPEFVEAGC